MFLHGIVDRRIEILGFPKEEQEDYISRSLRGSPSRKQELKNYLERNSIINNLCYIPLHLAILMYLFQQDSVPETLTEMNEYFIINTIYRHLERNKLSPPGIVKRLRDFPKTIVDFIYKLSKLAFEGLQMNQLIFTHQEIKKVCPEVDNIPGAINGFGLLQAIEHYPRRGAGRTTSVNFLHFTMQEYLAALHVSILPIEKQSIEMKTFWHSRFSFMWMMYVGIVGVKSDAFTSFITSKDNIYTDKRKCLHLFQCYTEAKSDAYMPKEVHSIFTHGEIILNGLTLLPHHISSLLFFISASKQQWKVLSLGDCNLRDLGMNSLIDHVLKNGKKMSTLEYVDLSGNQFSPWGVYRAIIRHCRVNNLTLCGDEGIKDYIKDISDSLCSILTLHSLTLCKIGSDGIQFIESILVDNTTLKELNLSWGSNAKGTKIINRQLKLNSHNSNELNVNILYDNYHRYLSKTISLAKTNIDDNAVHVIAFGLCNNTTVENLNLANNNIDFQGMNKLFECVEHSLPLKYVDLSGNKSSPWHVYCAIIRCCCGSKLTLYGDEGMKEYAMKVIDGLQHNITLESLTLCKMGSIGMDLIESILDSNAILKEVNLSWGSSASGTNIIKRLYKRNSKPVLHENNEVCVNILYDGDHECLSETINLSNKNIDDNAACVIAFGLYNNTTVKKLDLSHNYITVYGMAKLSECIEHCTLLDYIDLSENKSSPWSVYCATIRHSCVNSMILYGDEGMEDYVRVIGDDLQGNVTLESLTLCKFRSTGIQSVESILDGIATLKELNLSWGSNANGTKIIKRKLKHASHSDNEVLINILCDDYHECLSKTINLSNKNIDDNAVYVIAFGLYNNTTVKKLDLSHNYITVYGMNKLSECIEHCTSLDYVDLCENKSSPWGAYCATIRHCHVSSLTLCGDNGMKQYFKELTDSLQTNETLQSLILCASRNNVCRFMDMIVIANDTKKAMLVIDGEFYVRTLVSGDERVTDGRVVKVKVIYNDEDDFFLKQLVWQIKMLVMIQCVY